MKAQQGCLTNYSPIVNFLLKWYATDDNITTVNGDILNFSQGTLNATKVRTATMGKNAQAWLGI